MAINPIPIIFFQAFDIMIGGPGITIAVPTFQWGGYRKDHMARRGHH